MINQAEKQNHSHSETKIDISNLETFQNTENSQSSDDEIETKEELVIRDISVGLEIEQDPKKIFQFILKTASSYICLHLLIIAVTVFYIIDESYFKSFFKNYCTLGNGYDIACASLLGICILIPAISVKLGRILQTPLFIIMLISYIYLPAFILRISLKEKYNLSEIVLTIYPILFCTSIGLFINSFIGKDKFNHGPGIVIGGILSSAVILTYIWVLEIFDPYMWEIFLMVAGGWFWAFYVNYDVYLMSKRRNHIYRPNDWFVGMAHLHSDIIFRFWFDAILLVKNGDKNVEVEEVNDYNTEMIIGQ